MFCSLLFFQTRARFGTLFHVKVAPVCKTLKNKHLASEPWKKKFQHQNVSIWLWNYRFFLILKVVSSGALKWTFQVEAQDQKELVINEEKMQLPGRAGVLALAAKRW